MKNLIKMLCVLAFVALIVWASVSMVNCIAESDMNPWLKAWLLFGR